MSASARRKIVEQHNEIGQLRQRVAELEAENAGLKEENWGLISEKAPLIVDTRRKLAASQLREKQLRGALDYTYTVYGLDDFAKAALALPQDDSALREYLAWKMKPLVEALRPFAECAEVFDDERRGTTMPNSGPFQSWPRTDRDFELTVEDLRNAREALEAARKELS